MAHIDWLAALVAAVAAFLIGGLWFGPLFGQAKIRGAGTGVTDARANKGRTMGVTLAMLLISALVLAHIFAALPGEGLGYHLMVAGGVGLGFVAPALVTTNEHVRMPLAVSLIDAGYWIVAYLAMGLVFALIG